MTQDNGNHAAHTWSIKGIRSREAHGGAYEVAVIESEKDGSWIADVWVNRKCDRTARLIAAAPVLLGALNEAKEYFDQRADAEYLSGQAAPVGNEEMRLLVVIRAAIAKARKEG